MPPDFAPRLLVTLVILAGTAGCAGVGFADPVRPTAPPTANLTGRWRVEAVVPPGQPFDGKYTTTWELQDSGGRPSGSGVWSNGARSQYVGRVDGANVHLDRTDENGFRGTFDGTLSPDGQMMTGRCQNDPTSPAGNNAACTWTAWREPAAPPPPLSGPPPPAPGSPGQTIHNLTGRWQVEADVPPGQPFAGRYTTTWELTDQGGQLTGSGLWSNGARSAYAGWLRAGVIHLDRTDTNGFHATFDGAISADGTSMTGSCKNDPASSGGNAATCTWTARRL
jgi:hypothetical protein